MTPPTAGKPLVYPNRFLDFASIRNRIIFWLSWSLMVRQEQEPVKVEGGPQVVEGVREPGPLVRVKWSRKAEQLDYTSIKGAVGRPVPEGAILVD